MKVFHLVPLWAISNNYGSKFKQKKEIYNDELAKNPFCIPLWDFNNLYKQIQTRDEKDIVMKLQNLCELLIANLHEQIWEKNEKDMMTFSLCT